MKIYRVIHSGTMGDTISESFYSSKSKAKKALRKKFKDLKPMMAKEEDLCNISEPVVHKKQFVLPGYEKTKCFELMFEVWHKCSYEYDEWNLYVEFLNIDILKVD